MTRLAIIAAFLAASSTVHANSIIIQIPCGVFDETQNELAKSYGEQKAATGKVDTNLTSGGPEMFLYLNPTKNTYTIIIKKGDVACTAVSGTDFKILHLGEPT